MTRQPVLPPLAFAGLYAVLWGGSTAYLAAKGADWTFPLISLGIFGLAFSAVAWALTRSARPPAVLVHRPALELGAVLVFLAVYAVGFLGYGMTLVKGVFPPGPKQDLPGVDGYSTDLVQVAAFTVATLSPIAILFGVLWTRTRSLLLVVLLHATVDFLPHLPEFIQTW